MSFNLQSLERVNGGVAQANAVWVYSTADSIDAVEASGYFNEAKNLKLNDYLMIVASDGSAIYNVVQITPNVIIAQNGGDLTVGQKWTCNISDVFLNNNTSDQSPFPVGGQTITLDNDTLFYFESLIMLSSGGATHRQQFGFGGTATIDDIKYQAVGNSLSSGVVANHQGCYIDSTSLTNIGSNAAASSRHFSIRGSIRVSAGGTLTPLLRFDSAPGGTPLALSGSYFRIWEAGSSLEQTFGDWS